MPSPDPLKRLRGLDRSSAGFPDNLTNILLTEGWMDQAQNPSPEVLRELVEYLDKVCVLIAFSRSVLISIKAPRFSRPHQSCFLSLFVRTSKNLWCPQDLANVARTLPPSFGGERRSGRLWNFGQYTQRDPQQFGGLCQKDAGLFQ